MKRDQIIIRVDGGICSQIAFVSIGRYLQAKYPSAEVRYDLSWFEDYGKDLNGNFVRNWDFEKAFPSLAIKTASRQEAEKLAKRHPRVGTDVTAYVPPVYVGGYPHFDPILYVEAPRMRDAFCPELGDASRGVLDEIESCEACAIHVRRGDLANYDVVYGKPATAEYFVRAIKIVGALASGVRFFLFSDEPEWVSAKLLPKLPAEFAYKVVMGNGSDRGFEDLFLISRCEHVISSAGSLGVVGALLSRRLRTLVVNRNRECAFKFLKNVIYLNDCYHEFSPPERPHGLFRKINALLHI